MAHGRPPRYVGGEGVNRLAGWIFVLVFAHLAAVVLHTIAHVALQITPGPADTVFIVGVIMIAPIAALLLFRFSDLLGSGLLAVAMIAAFAYGVYGHFLAPGPDNVTMVAADARTLVFVGTGIGIGTLEIATVMAAAIVFAWTIRTLPAPAGPSS